MLFLNCLLYFVCFFGGVCIIPKWLIKVPRPFPILVGWFRELRKSNTFSNTFSKIWTRGSPNYYQNAQTNTRTIMESSWICLSICDSKNRTCPSNCMSEVPYIVECVRLFSLYVCVNSITYFENIFCGDEDRKMINVP